MKKTHLENVDALVVGPEVVDLFLENARPEIFANKFHQIQFVFKLGIFASQLLDQTISGIKSNMFLGVFSVDDNLTFSNFPKLL